MKYSPIFALGLILVLSSCESTTTTTSGSVSVDTSGNCTSTYVTDYNHLVFESSTTSSYLKGSWYSAFEKQQQVQTLQNACQKFKSTHGVTSCVAEVDYQTKLVGYSDIQRNCDAADAYLAPAQPTPPPAPIVLFLNEVNANRIYAYAKDSAKLVRLGTDRNLVIVDGELLDINSVTGGTICFVTAVDPYRIRDYDRLNLLSKEENITAAGNREISLVFNNGNLVVSCTHAGNERFSLREVKQALRSVISITLL